ncbi:MAG: hypothetical protein LUE98_07805 [Tannerellaceae bacterium]|nr:hypothetical protein [Tannerellaceae bacterium]
MGKFDLNIKKLGLLLLPTFLRRPVIASLMYASVTGLHYIYSNFLRVRTGQNYRLTHNGQVCYLKAVLNDSFDTTSRRIRISDSSEASEISIIYKREEEKPVYLWQRKEGGGMIINKRGFSGTQNFDFYIEIPYSLYNTLQIEQVAALANTYKLASKRYKFSIYNERI